MSLMMLNYNSRVLSRIGFVTQEIMDLEAELSSEIQNRTIEINDAPECILQARSDLEVSWLEAGNALQTVTLRLNEDLATLNEAVFQPAIDEIELLVSLFEVEILNLLSYVNSVTNMIFLLIVLESEIRQYGVLFEYYVDDIYEEMVIWSMFTDEFSQNAFPQLDASLAQFRSSVDSIRGSLVNCN